jgi:2-polyprenyl-3-methyl-5-hydroxy-6-metoxy-1,4-benzoquinol methylase
MSSTVHYSHCPVCNNEILQSVFTVKDYTVSQQDFMVMECPQCTLRFTQNVPDTVAIVDYYKADTYISHTNTSKGLIHSIYKRVRKKTLRQKRKLIEAITEMKQGNLLDIGAGTGAFVKEMKNAGWGVTGLEPDKDARAVALSDFSTPLLPIEELLHLEKGFFNAITLWHVLEHVHDLNGYLDTLKNLLKPNGKLIIAVPNYTAKDAAIYQQHWAAYDVPRHLYHFSPKAMQLLVEKHNMKIVTHYPMWYDSFYVSLLSSKYRNGKFNPITAVINGLRSNWQARKNATKCSSVIYVIAAA